MYEVNRNKELSEEICDPCSFVCSYSSILIAISLKCLAYFTYITKSAAL